MPDDNKAIARRSIEEVWNQRNLAAIPQLFAADHVHHDPNTTDIAPGLDGLRQLVNLYTSAFPDVKLTIQDIFDRDDRVVVRWTAKGTHRGELRGIAPTGKEITTTGVDILRIQSGKIAETWVQWDALGLMQQIGAVRLIAQAAG